MSSHAADARFVSMRGLIGAGIVGFAVAWTPLFAIFHELGHAVIGVLDPDIAIGAVGWRDTWFRGDPSVLFYAAGYATSAALGVIVSIVATRKGKLALAAFALGTAATQPIYAAFSTDYRQMADRLGTRPTLTTWALFATVSVIFVFATASMIRQEARRKQTHAIIARARANLRNSEATLEAIRAERRRRTLYQPRRAA